MSWVKLSELPKPHRFFYKGTKRKRDVEVKLFVCPGFTHTYADLNEEDDVVWDPRDKQWKRPENEYDDDDLNGATGGFKFISKEFSGRRYHMRFEDATKAEHWVLKETSKNFPKETHRLVDWRNHDETWKPKRIGKTKRELMTKCSKCKLPVSERGTNATGDWTGGPYCDICSRYLPPYGDYKAKAVWEKVTTAQAQKWTKEKSRVRA
jgi:hypothetical protein